MKNFVWMMAMAIFAIATANKDLYVFSLICYVVAVGVEELLVRFCFYAKFDLFSIGNFIVMGIKGHAAVRGLLLKTVIEKDDAGAEACLLAKEYFEKK